jgi:AAA15 family ATPase/GTPase
MKQLSIKNLGPIQSADFQFGDLTFFVGPQASGKSIILQMIKLLEDKPYIRKSMESQNFTWPKDPGEAFDQYMGEGMGGIWSPTTKIKLDKHLWKKENLKFTPGERYKESEEKVFYIPAQRVMAFDMDWIRTYSAFSDSTPYVLKHFSESVRQILEAELSKRNSQLFPVAQQLKVPIRNAINSAIFNGGRVITDRKKRKSLNMEIEEQRIPFMSWSAGQKEFMPLLLAFYWLCPPSKVSMKKGIETVILEEPEMGLHPKAIIAVLLQVLDLIARGYKVILSTHSTIFLEFSWAVLYFKENKYEEGLYDLFGLKKGPTMDKIFSELMKKKIKTYYFNRGAEKVTIEDISTLDSEDLDSSIANWGGLSSFASQALDIVSKHAAQQ